MLRFSGMESGIAKLLKQKIKELIRQSKENKDKILNRKTKENIKR